ncbi:hypothetical protein JCM11491_006118 [Sporobolomyces phaffii]
MSDSESDSSAASPQLDEAVELSSASPSQSSTKPLASTTEPAFARNGVFYRSVGVLCTPELAREAATEAEDKLVKVDRLTTLPDHVLECIIDWTVAIALAKADKAVQDADWTDCGRLPTPKVPRLRTARKQRHALFGRLSKVSRRFYHLVRPKFWRILDLSAYTSTGYHTYSIQTLGQVLPSKTEVLQRPTGTSDAPAQNGVIDKPTSDMSGGGSTSTETSAQGESATVGNSPPPRKKRKKTTQGKGSSPSESSPPTAGELVDTIVIGSCGSVFSTFVETYLQHLWNLQHVFLPRKTNTPLQWFRAFAENATYTLRTVDHLHFLDNHEDNESRVEAILTLFNAAPNLERFGVSGKLSLDELRGKRLSFVWKLNARLKHTPTGCLGVGLKQLYLGRGVEVTVGFLRSLKQSCPRLTKLHIAAGVKVNTDATPQGSLPFDLAVFATEWSTLTSLSLVGTDTFSTAGTLDAILKVCPALTHLHVRSDHITYGFFATIVNDLALAALPPAGPPAERLAPRQIGSETAASTALVEASKSYKKGKTGLKHPIRHMAITYRLGNGVDQTQKARVHITGPTIVSFSLLVVAFQARGLAWPDEMGGQRDLLNRAALMINLEHKKERDRRARDKAELEQQTKDDDDELANVGDAKEKGLGKAKGKGKGKGKGKQQDEDESEGGEDDESLLDIDITTDA